MGHHHPAGLPPLGPRPPRWPNSRLPSLCHCQVGPPYQSTDRLHPPEARPGTAAATSRLRYHRPDDPSSPRNGTALLPFFTPHSPLHFPSPPNQMAGIDAATTGRPIPFPVRPPRFPSDPIKGRGVRPSSPHSSPPPFPTLRALSTTAALTIVARPPHYLLSSGERTTGFPVFHSPSPTPWPVQHGPWLDMVHRPRTESTDYSIQK
jgi:hypothetical protein